MNRRTSFMPENDLCLIGVPPPNGINIHSRVLSLGGVHNSAVRQYCVNRCANLAQPEMVPPIITQMVETFEHSLFPKSSFSLDFYSRCIRTGDFNIMTPAIIMLIDNHSFTKCKPVATCFAPRADFPVWSLCEFYVFVWHWSHSFVRSQLGL